MKAIRIIGIIVSMIAVVFIVGVNIRQGRIYYNGLFDMSFGELGGSSNKP